MKEHSRTADLFREERDEQSQNLAKLESGKERTKFFAASYHSEFGCRMIRYRCRIRTREASLCRNQSTAKQLTTVFSGAVNLAARAESTYRISPSNISIVARNARLSSSRF